jgi:hypothetical protein
MMQPTSEVFITMQWDGKQHEGQLICLSDTQLHVRCPDYIDKEATVVFFSKHFRGVGVVKVVQFAQLFFNYTLHIEQIEYQ